MNYRIRLLDESLKAFFQAAELACECESLSKESLENLNLWISSIPTEGPTVIIADAARYSPTANEILRCCRRQIDLGRKIAVLGVLEWGSLNAMDPEDFESINSQLLDDFIMLPILPLEVNLRISRLAQQAITRAESTTQNLRCGPLMFELETLKTTAYGKALQLTRRETELLLFLCKQPLAIVTRQQIATQVWKVPKATASFDSVLNGHLSRLRSKLAAGGCKEFLKSIPKQGITVNPSCNTN
jgi:DNA-binding winged helix-turn-helix (wHTH) protein